MSARRIDTARERQEVFDEPEERKHPEGAVLAGRDSGSGPQRSIDPRVLPPAEVQERQFYWWQRRLSLTRQTPEGRNRRPPQPASFALVSEDAGANYAGIELLLASGRRLRIARGVDEATLRAVLAAAEPEGC